LKQIFRKVEIWGRIKKKRDRRVDGILNYGLD
jgi:hypothetical protein